MLPSGGGLDPAGLLSQFVGGSSSNEARIRLLERRITGQALDFGDGTQQQRIFQAGTIITTGCEAQPGLGLHRLGSCPEHDHAGAFETANDDVRGNDFSKRRKLGELAHPSGLYSSDGHLQGAELEQQVPGPSVPASGLAKCFNNKDQGFKRKRSARSSPEPTSADSPAHAVAQDNGEHSRHTPGGKATPVRSLSRPSPQLPKSQTKVPRQAQTKGQTKVHSFFPILDGSSRDSEPVASMVPEKGTAAAAQGAFTATLHTAHAAQQQQLLVSAASGHTLLTAIPESSGEERAIQLQQQLELKDKEAREREDAFRQQEQALTSRLEQALAEAASFKQAAEQMQQRMQDVSKTYSERDAKCRAELARLVQMVARSDRELQRMQLASSSVRLGTVSLQRTGAMQIQEVWEEGQAYHHLSQRQQALAHMREEVEAARKALRKKIPLPPSARQSKEVAGEGAGGSQKEEGSETLSGPEFVTQDEIFKLRLAALKREEESLRQEEERLNMEKFRHVRALKRQRDEDGSRFNTLNVLTKRYQLMNMLGKGGFSEVYKAYDLNDMRVVAVKIHQVNPHWAEYKKHSYVKHAVREYEIHKGLRHPNIVGLLDVLEIDNNSFATVLDLCEGPDLDTVLREHGTLPEKEARSVIAQMFSALVYLNQPGRRIIHYDLKPANILFDTMGQAKITDFGLSKIVEEGQTMGMELTSQGAGTYWYLPPECFELSGQAPRITNKVDVWSAGVIFYQMLFGKRPFGEGLSQEQIMRERIMLNATEVEFPTKPSTSAEAKEFIRRCLAYKQEVRWDVMQASQDSYLSLAGKAGDKGGSKAAGAQQGQAQTPTSGFMSILSNVAGPR